MPCSFSLLIRAPHLYMPRVHQAQTLVITVRTHVTKTCSCHLPIPYASKSLTPGTRLFSGIRTCDTVLHRLFLSRRIDYALVQRSSRPDSRCAHAPAASHLLSRAHTRSQLLRRWRLCVRARGVPASVWRRSVVTSVVYWPAGRREASVRVCERRVHCLH